jgi:hypothetical protein
MTKSPLSKLPTKREATVRVALANRNPEFCVVSDRERNDFEEKSGVVGTPPARAGSQTPRPGSSCGVLDRRAGDPG